MEQTTIPYASGKNWTLYAGECSRVMRDCIEDESIDLTVTSRPYEDLRSYNGFHLDLNSVARQLYRVTKQGRIVVWVIGDIVRDGDTQMLPFEDALIFKSAGFLLHDIMIYQKNNYFGGQGQKPSRYRPCFEYMLILGKGRPEVFNPIMEDCTYAGVKLTGNSRKNRQADNRNSEHLRPHTGNHTPDQKIADNIWSYTIGYMHSTKDSFAYEHPAMFPEALVRDHIISWSNPGDLVLDPFIGSGTTGKMAAMLGRPFIGIDISSEYLEIAKRRIDLARLPLFEHIQEKEQAEQGKLL